MPFRTEGPRERILLYGGPGAGKTRAYLDIANQLQKSGSDAHMYVIDTDFAVERMMTGFPDLENVTYAEVVDYSEAMEAVTKFQTAIKPGDWMVCDLINVMWDYSQQHYTQEVYGVTLDEYFLERRAAAAKKAKSKQSDEGFEGLDWQIIKPMYQAFSNRFFHRHRGHVLACAGAKGLNRDGKWADSKELIDTFGAVGIRPEGEKRVAHQVHTALYLRKSNVGEFQFTTAKDRERETMLEVGLGTEDAPGSFAKKYLLSVAKWKLR